MCVALQTEAAGYLNVRTLGTVDALHVMSASLCGSGVSLTMLL